MSFLKQYKLKVTALSPIFIGSGKSLTKKEYIFDEQQIKYIDLQKFIKLIYRKNLTDDYKCFITRRQNGLCGWMKSERLTREDINSVVLYKVWAGGALKNKSSEDRVKGIQMFIKDAFNKPYIPGSSVKGALRTAVLANMVLGRDYSDKYVEYKNSISSKNILKGKAEAVEIQCLNTLNLRDKSGKKVKANNAVNSVMRGITISDGRPLPYTNLIVCPKKDLPVNGDESTFHDVNIVRECLKPGTVSEHTLTLNTQILSESGIDKDYILHSIRAFYEAQYRYFISKFKFREPPDDNNKYKLFLGGGSGYVSKTIMYPAMKEKALQLTAKLMKEEFSKGHHENDLKKEASPHMLKCTEYNGKKYLMGKCGIEIT